MQCVHYMNRIDIYVDMKKLTLTTYLRGRRMVIRDRDLSVFIKSEPETLLLKTSKPARDAKRQKFTMVEISKDN